MSDDIEDKYVLDTSDAERGLAKLIALSEQFTAKQQEQLKAMEGVVTGLDRLDDSVQQTVEASQQANEAARELVDGQQKLNDSVQQTSENTGQAVVKWQLYVAAVKEVVQFAKEAVEAFAAQEKASNLLTFALQQHGFASADLAAKLRLEAVAQEQLTGYRREEIENVQRLLIQYGVAPEKLGAVTKATEDLAAATGTDLQSAAMLLAKAEEGLTSTLSRHGIVLDDTTDKSKILDQAVQQIEDHMGGTAQAAMMGANGQVVSLGNAFHNLTTGVGEFISDASQLVGITPFLTREMQALANAMRGPNADAHAAKNLEEDIKSMRSQLASAEQFMAELQDQAAVHTNATVDFQIKEQQKVIDYFKDQLMQLQGISKEAPLMSFDDGEALEVEGKTRQYYKKLKDIMLKGSDELIKLQNEEDAKLAKENEKAADQAVKEWEKLVAEREKQQQKDELNLERWAARVHNRQLQGDKQFMAELERQQKEANQVLDNAMKYIAQDAANVSETLLNMALGNLTQSLTQNQQYTDQYNALQDKRTQADLKSMGIQQSLAQVTKERQNEEKANREAELASVLANIAQQAAIKAIFTAAEATADIWFNPAKSATEFAAAGMYGAVAAVAGGAAAAITSSRGMTTEEASSLRGAQQQNMAASGTQTAINNTKGSYDSQSGMNVQHADTIVNVYQIGIAGATESQQAQEIARIQKLYDQNRMGG